MLEYKLYINGEFRDASDNGTMDAVLRNVDATTAGKPPALPSPAERPAAAVVIYDGDCGF